LWDRRLARQIPRGFTRTGIGVIIVALSALTRRRNDDPHREGWSVSYAEAIIGHIEHVYAAHMATP
jgi:hypothetical protein